MAIQIRRGTNAQWESNNGNIVSGEPAIATDTKRFFVGTGTGTFAEFPSIEKVFDMIYPVGSIYMSVNSTSPATLFGGTWEQIEDTFLLASGSTYEAGEVGGEATHTLTEAELPTISGSFKIRKTNGGVADTVYATSGKFTKQGISDDYTSLNVSSNNNTAQQVTFSFGSGNAHTNMPPYVAVYVWKRTA